MSLSEIRGAGQTKILEESCTSGYKQGKISISLKEEWHTFLLLKTSIPQQLFFFSFFSKYLQYPFPRSKK